MSRLLPRLLAVVLAVAAIAATPAVAGRHAHRSADDPGYGVPAIMWSGREWIPRVTVTAQKPYKNYWSAAPNALYVDTSGRLHMWLRKVGGVWTAAELRSADETFGYGTYTFTVETPIGAMDPHQVLGLFTRNNTPTQNEVENAELWGNGQKGDPRYVDHAEADVEIGKWDWAARGHPHRNAQYVVQPWWQQGRLKHLWLPPATPYTVQFEWRQDSTVFTVWRGATTTGKPVSRWVSPFSNGVPRPGTTVNLETWLIFERPPARDREQEVVIDSFDYQPSTG